MSLEFISALNKRDGHLPVRIGFVRIHVDSRALDRGPFPICHRQGYVTSRCGLRAPESQITLRRIRVAGSGGVRKQDLVALL